MRERVAELCRQLAPIMPDRVNALWLSYLTETTAEARAQTEQTLELMAATHLQQDFTPDRQPFPPPPEGSPPKASPQESSPQASTTCAPEAISLGRVLYGGVERHPWRFPVQALNTHALVCGRSGSGKTVLTMHLAKALIHRGIVTTVFDWKRSYRTLLDQLPPGTVRLYTPGRESVAPMRWNPLIPPPGCEPMLYGKLIVDVICRALLGGEGVISLMHQGIESLYKLCGVLDGRPDRYPTIQDLLDWVQRTKLTGRAGMWKASAERILRAMTYGDFGRMMDTQSSADVLTLLDTHTVIELDGLAGSADRQLFAEGLTLWMQRYLLARGERPQLERVWIHEEAHHLFHQSETTTQETVLEQALRLIRAYGVGVIVVDQQASSLSRTVFANTGLTLCLNQKLRSDLQAIASALNLTTQQRDALSTLPVGTAIARLPDQHPEPFLIRIPPPAPHTSPPDGCQSFEAATTDEDLIVAEWLKLKTKNKPPPRTDPGRSPPESPSHAPPGPITPIPAADRNPPTPTPIQPPRQAPTPTSLNPSPTIHPPINMPGGTHPPAHPGAPPSANTRIDQQALLEDVIEHPLSTTVQRYERLRMSRRRGHAARSQLVKQDLLQPVRLATRAGNVVLLELTEEGRRQARGWGLSPPPRPHDGLDHRYWIDRVAASLDEQGYGTRKEHTLAGNGRVDIWATRKGRTLQVEVETGKSTILTNLSKGVAHADRVWLVATSPEALRRCEQAVDQLTAEQKDRVEVHSWLDYS